MNQSAPKTGRKPVRNRANRRARRIPNLLTTLASKYLIVLYIFIRGSRKGLIAVEAAHSSAVRA